jgi:hypothetical protein
MICGWQSRALGELPDGFLLSGPGEVVMVPCRWLVTSFNNNPVNVLIEGNSLFFSENRIKLINTICVEDLEFLILKLMVYKLTIKLHRFDYHQHKVSYCKFQTAHLYVCYATRPQAVYIPFYVHSQSHRNHINVILIQALFNPLTSNGL